jgi:hypothetical protein
MRFNSKKYVFLITLLATLLIASGAVAANKTFTGTGNFSTAARWGGTLPVAGDVLRINGACTFDDAAANLAYGTLEVSRGAAGSIVWPVGGTNTLNVTTVLTGTFGAGTIDMTNGGTLRVRTSWTSNNTTLISGTGTIYWNVTGAASTLPAVITNYNNLTIVCTGRVASLGVATTINGNLLISAGTLSASASNFTLNIKGDFTNNATFNPTSGTVAINSSGDQTISGTTTPTTFKTLTIDKSSGIAKLGVNITTSANLTISSGTFDLSSYTANRTTSGGTLTVSNGATLKIGGTNTLPSNYSTHTFGASSTIEYAGTNQSVASETYPGHLTFSGNGTKTMQAGTTSVGGNLTLSGTAVATTGANLAVSGNLDVGSGTTFATGTNYTLGVTGTSSITGILTLAGTAAKTFIGDVIINSGGFWNETAVAAITYAGNLLNNGTYTANTGVHTFSGTAKTINGTSEVAIPSLTISGTTTNNGTLTVSTTLSGASILTNGDNATLNFGGSSITPTLTASASGNTVNYIAAAGGQTIKTGTYYTLTMGNTSGTQTAGGAISATTLNNNTNAADILNMVTYTLTATTVNNSGTIQTQNTSGTPLPTGFTWGGTVIYDAATGSQTVMAGNYTTLTMGNSSGTQTAGGAISATTLNNNTNAADILNMVTYTLTATTINNSGTIRTQNTSGTPLPTGLTWGGSVLYDSASTQTIVSGDYNNLDGRGGDRTLASNGTIGIAGIFTPGSGTYTVTGSSVNYNGSSQSIAALTYNNLTINQSSGNVTLGGNVTVNGTLTLTSGTFPVAGNNLTLNGPTIAGTPANLSTSSSSSLVFGGSSVGVNIPGIVTGLNNLTINNINGVTLNGSPTINGTLTLTGGNIIAGSYTLAISSTGSVSRTSGHIVGNFKKYIATGAVTKTFEIGNGSDYLPVTVAFDNVTVAGDLTISTTSGDHPDISNSGLDSAKSVNRFWTLTNSGITFNNYSVTFNFVSSDIDAAANTANLIVGNKNGGIWNKPTVGAKTSTSTQATGLTVFGDFILGEENNTKTWDGGASTNNWGDAANWSPDGVPVSTNDITLSGADAIDVNMAGICNNLILDNAGLILTIKSGYSLTISGNLTVMAGTLNTEESFPTVGGTTTLTAGTVGYTASSGSQTVAVQNYVNLTIGGGGTKTLAGTITPGGNLTIGGGTFDLGGYAANRSSAGGTLTVANGATLKIGGTGTLPSNFSTHSIGISSTVEYAGTTTTVASLNSSQNYGNLIISGTGVTTANSFAVATALTVNSGGSFIPSAGVITMNTGSSISNSGTLTFQGLSIAESAAVTGSGNLSVSGTLTVNSGGTFTPSQGDIIGGTGMLTGNGSVKVIRTTATADFNSQYTISTKTLANLTVEYAGSAAQEISSLTYGHLKVNNANGVTLGGNVTVDGTLTLASGNITTGASSVIISSTGSVSRMSGYVVGNFQKFIATGATSKTFEIGDASNYTPVDISFASVSVGGNLTANTTAGDHPNIGITNINSTKSVNRYWTLANSGITFTTYGAIFNFVAGDIDGSANTNNFIVGNYNSGWTYPTVGTKTSASTEATGMTSFGDFQLGENAITGNTKKWDGGASTNNWNDAANWNPNGVPIASSDVIIDGGYSVAISTASAVCASLTIGTGIGSGSLTYMATTAGNYTLTVSGNVSVASNGSFTVTNQTTTNTHTLNIGGNLDVQGTFNMVSGTDDVTSVVFNGTSQQNISGNSSTTCNFYSITINNTSSAGVVLSRNIVQSPATTISLNPTLIINSGYTFDLSTYTCNSSASGIGTFTVNAGSKLRIGGTNNFPSNYTTFGFNETGTVEYYGNDQTLEGMTYGNLILSGSGTKTTGGEIIVNTSLTVGDGVTFSPAAYNLTVAGTTTIGSGSGSTAALSISSATGLKTFTGLMTVAANGLWDNSAANSPVSFVGGITNNGTFTAGTGVYTFQSSAQALKGTFSIPSITVTGITLTNINTLTVGTELTGTGQLINSATGVLNIGGTCDIITLTATAVGNTVNFNGAGSQTIPAFDYYNLTSSSSGDRILATTSPIGIAGTFTPGSNSYTIDGSTINFNASGSQTVPVFIYSNLIFSSSGTKSLSGGITIEGSLSITGSAVANLGSDTSTASTLLFGTTPQVSGSWGGTASSATNKNSTYFGTTATGILNVTATIYTYTWTGGTSTAWEVATNWSSSQVPTSSDAAVIANTTRKPVISSAASCKNITINSGATLTISGANSLTVSGNWTNNGGTFTAGTGTVTFNGTMQTIGGSSTTTFYNVITSGTTNTTIGRATNISGNLLIEDGTVFTAAGYNLTVTGTTTVGQGTSGILNISSATGTKLFSGLVTVTTGGIWSNTTANSPVSFAGGITNNGTFNAGTGVYTFQTNSQSLTGTISIPNVTVTGITLTNNNSFTVGTALSGTGGLSQSANSILNLGGTTTITTLTTTADPNTVNYTGSSQTLKVTTYNNLILSGGAKTFGAITTVNGSLTLSGDATATTGAALTIGGNLTVGDGTTFTVGAYSLNVTGTITVGIGGLSTATLIISSSTGTKTFNGAVTISTNGILIENAAARLSFGSDITINGTLTENGAAIVGFAGNLTNNGTYTASTGVHTFSGSEKTIGGSNNNAIPSVTISGSYTNNQTLVCIDALTVSGSLTNNSTINLTATTPSVLSGAGTLTNNETGVLNIGGPSTITTLIATASGNLVNYYGAAQTVIATSYYNLTLSSSGAKTFPAGTTTVNGTLSIENGANANVFTGILAYGPNATLQYNTTSARTASVEWISPFAALGGVIVKNTGAITLNSARVFDASVPLTINSGATLITGNYQMSFGGDFINNGGTFTCGSSPIVITNTAAVQNIAGFSTTGMVSMTKTAGTATFTGNVNSNGLIVNGSGGTLNLGSSKTHNITDVTLTAGVLDGGSSILNVSGAWTGTTTFTAGTGTVNYDGSSQVIAPLTYNHLTINQSSGNVTLGGDVTVNGNLTLNSGTFPVAGNTLTLNGPTISGTPANLSTTSSSSLVFGGSSIGINIPGTVTTLNNLTINNSNGVTLNSSPTINGTLTLNGGSITTGSNTLSISSTGTVSRTSGHVAGKFKKYIAAGATEKTFEIGDASNYTPVNIVFGNVTVAGDLTAFLTLGDHPDIANSGVDGTKSVNRYWTLTNGGIVFDNYSAIFNFVSGDIDASAGPVYFIVANKDGVTWTKPTVGTKTSVNIQVIGMTVFGDFVVGEASGTVEIIMLKSVQTVSDPVNNTTNPKAIPGAVMLYTVQISNNGPRQVDNNTTIITDPISSTTKLFVNNLGVPGSGPVSFTDGSPSSRLSYTFTSLSDSTDDIGFSNDSGSTWTYVPTPDADGCDSNVTHIRINPKGTFAGANGGNPSFAIRFKVQIK